MRCTAIYRDFETTLSKAKLGVWIQHLAVCNGRIEGMHVLKNGFREDKAQYWEAFFKLRFEDSDGLARFHKAGFKTIKPEQITGQNEGSII